MSDNSNNFVSSIGERLCRAMKIRNLKPVDLVRKTGISSGAISSYVTGRYQPKYDGISKLANALNVSEGWLMGLDVNIEPSSNDNTVFDTPSSLKQSVIHQIEKMNDSELEKLHTLLQMYFNK